MKKLIVVLLILNLLANLANLVNATKISKKRYGLVEEGNVWSWISYFDNRMDAELRIDGPHNKLVLKNMVSELTRLLLNKDVISEKEWQDIMGNSEEHEEQK